jgi:NADPH:quinone reductase-like Zn-dependent oxidoreductase
MKAAVFHAFGGPEVIDIEEVATPEPGSGEVRLRVLAAALNHLDLWVRRGLPIETTMPHIGGSDVAGVVTGLGPGPAAPAQGTPVVVNPSLWCGECEWCRRGEQPLCVRFRILGEHTQGGLAEYVTVPAANLLSIPEGYPVAQAAAAPLTFVTAWRGLVTRAQLQPGESVLITGASGGGATAALQIARYIGARVYAVTTGDQAERVRALGADVVYDRERVDFSQELWRDTGKRGVDVVLDSVGSATWPGVLRSVARLGRLVVYGATTGPQAQLDLRALFWKQVSIMGTTMSTQAEFETVMSLVFDGTLTPVVDVVWPLARVREAHQRLERGEHFGKIVLVP